MGIPARPKHWWLLLLESWKHQIWSHEWVSRTLPFPIAPLRASSSRVPATVYLQVHGANGHSHLLASMEKPKVYYLILVLSRISLKSCLQTSVSPLAQYPYGHLQLLRDKPWQALQLVPRCHQEAGPFTDGTLDAFLAAAVPQIGTFRRSGEASHARAIIPAPHKRRKPLSCN